MSAASRRLRGVALEKVFGGGLGGFLASAALGWAIDQIRSAGDPVAIDVADLRPGERYVVTARPPMKRSEAKLYKKHHKAKRRLESATRPSGRVLRTAKRLQRQQRLADKRRPGTRGRARAEAKAERLGERYDRLTAPTRRVEKLSKRVAAYDAQLAVHREKALAPTRRRRRVPRTRTYLR